MGEGAAVEGWMNKGRRVSQKEQERETYDKSDQDLDGTGLLNNKLSDSKLMIDRCEKKEPDTPERGQWSNPCDFFISCLGYAVGLGNIWRFPFLCFKHGGGSFLIPYFLMLFLAGLPVFLLEIAVGQYAGVGPIKIFGHMAPIARGLGFAVVCVGLFLAFFYNVVVSWAIWYLVASFNPNLDWIRCGHWYNSPNCWSVVNQDECEATGLVFWNNTCTDLTSVCSPLGFSSNLDDGLCVNGTNKIELEQLQDRTSASAEYFERFVLGNRGHDWYNFGQIRWQNVCCLAAAWLLVALCLIKGVKSSGKVVYFTSLFPYAVLIMLACRGFTLPGAIDGISYYLTPDWSRLTTTEVWVDAATQVIFSLGPACGCVITLSSYNRFDRNCHKDAVLVALSNSVTSLFSGLVVFSILGFMAHVSDKEVKDVVSAGPGLAFIVYPEVVSRIPFSQIWAALFFLMLITLALGSIFGAFETVITALSDQWPALRAFKPQVVLITSFVMLVLGLPFCCNGGIHMFTLFNASAPSWNLLLFALLEVVLVSWVYGVDKFLDNLSEMDINLPAPVKFYWKYSWKYSTPGILAVLLVFSWYDFGHVGYKGEDYPFWVQILGYMITGCTLIALPIVGGCEVVKRYPETTEVFSSLIRPTQQWGPNHYQTCEDTEDKSAQSLP
eukprot:GFUD01022965.1.p1 GENE.GFUD01022965.1~~GFUD01022965.1.p1  ORF type:complete len:666 (-),score=86.69 GFUD01022965.1:154-2151(-)